MPVFWNNRWYIFLRDNSNSDILLYYTEPQDESFLSQSWTEHPSSPIISGGHWKSGGRPFVRNGEFIDLYPQDGSQNSVHTHRVTQLSSSSITQSEIGNVPILRRWTDDDYTYNSASSHHVDRVVPNNAGRSIVAVDGRTSISGDWSIGIFTDSSKQPSGHLSSKIQTRQLFRAPL